MPFPETAINFLQGIDPPGDQDIRVGRFYQCYDILLSHNDCPLAANWGHAKAHIAAISENGRFDHNSRITRGFLEQFMILPQLAYEPPPTDYGAVYLLAMLWGYGSTGNKPAKDGPAKLFVSTQTDGALAKLELVANFVMVGGLAKAFDLFCLPNGDCKLRETGPSFGSKFLYAVGLALDDDIQTRPLVFDSRIDRSLKALMNLAPVNDQNRVAMEEWIRMTTGEHYAAYCACMAETAPLINQAWSAYVLEQLLFEHNGQF